MPWPRDGREILGEKRGFHRVCSEIYSAVFFFRFFFAACLAGLKKSRKGIKMDKVIRIGLGHCDSCGEGFLLIFGALGLTLVCLKLPCLGVRNCLQLFAVCDEGLWLR